ncbi:NlpC/P60 family protein [soil metagenome]
MLVRSDLAEQGAEGLVRASSYRAVQPMHARLAVVDVHLDAGAGSERIDQLLFGEAFDVLDRRPGPDGSDQAWGRARRDGVVGWVDRAGLAPGAPLATHRVASTDAALPLNALVHHSLSGVALEDLAPVGLFETDLAAVAERLLRTPHSLGARSSRATDCSGLVQQALYACGLAGPRHSDQQALLGQAVEPASARRGDIVVWLNPGQMSGEGRSWTGHSALMFAADQVIHATGHHGLVTIESLAAADARYRDDGFDAPLFRRITL